MRLVKFTALLCIVLFLFMGCDLIGNSGGSKDPGNKNPSTNDGEELPEGVNPKPYGSRYENLDFIFSTESVGKVTITMKRSEWKQMLKNYDYFYKNENCVKFTRFEYEKDGVRWDLTKGGGIRLRGNTSRFRPQGKDSPNDQTGHHQMNEDWSKEYYNYAKNCSDNDYRQSHFKIDFEEFLEGDDEQKMADCMKGLALKRMDGSCTKEIFCYDLFHRYGIWTAPRASHTRVFFNFIEDDGRITTVNYGVYEMFEEVNKQSLKARDKDENSAKNAWKNSKGNLWKCAGGDLANPYATMYPEQVEITEFDSKGNPKKWVWDSPTYDLKTNKDNVDAAAAEMRQFITELNGLPDVTRSSDTESIDKIKAFYEKWMDVEFFLKTYAINILVGMDDDYWSNANNYYLYFGDAKDGSRKVYFIPFDYDNTIGASIKGNHDLGEKEGIEQNPFEWGRGANRPLMDKLLQVPEYRQLFRDKLIEVSSAENEWNYEKCSARWRRYWDMVGPYLYSPDLSDHVCTKGYWDNVYKPSGYSLVNKGNNIYDYTRKCFLGYLQTITVDLNGGTLNGQTGVLELSDFYSSNVPEKYNHMFLGWTLTKDGNDYVENFKDGITYYARWQDTSSFRDLEIFEIENTGVEGICIGIYGMPDDAAIRTIYVVNNLEDRWYESNNYIVSEMDNYRQSSVNKNVWVYPYTQKDKQYRVKLLWKNSSWNWIDSPDEIIITAKSGVGENTVDFGAGFNPREDSPYAVNKGILTWTHNPKINVCGSEISSANNPGALKVTLRGGGDGIWAWYGDTNMEYPMKDHNVVTFWDKYFKANSWNSNSVASLTGNPYLYLCVTYEITDETYGNYRLVVIDDYRDLRYFSF